MADHDLERLPSTTERRQVLVYIPGNLIDPFGHWEYREQNVQVVDLTSAPTLRSGDSMSFTTTIEGTPG
jgi:hypothetical protein